MSEYPIPEQRLKEICSGIEGLRPCDIADNTEIDLIAPELLALRAENTRLLNDASIWRNRAINAEEELAGTNRIRKARAALADKESK